VKTSTIVDCSGVGPGGITRVLTEVIRYWPSGQQLCVVAPPSGWEPPADAVNEVDVLGSQGGSRIATIASAARILRKVTAEWSRRDAGARVLSMSPSAAIASSRLPVTTIVHDLAFKLWPRDLSRSVRAYRRFSYATAIRRSAHLLCVSARTLHDLHGHYDVQEARAGVWSPGSDLAADPGELPRVLADLRSRGGRYLLVAGHAMHKGVELAIGALPRLDGVSLAVLTGGQDAAGFRRVAATSGLGERVHFLGHLSDSDYVATVRASEAFLMPSHFEGYGLPAAEALRLGTPVVISPDPALHEATEGKAVRMVAWSPSALADAVVIARAAPRAAQPVGSVGAAQDWQEATARLFAVLHESEGVPERVA